MADGNEDFLKSLKRFSSPKSFADSWGEQRKLISSGQLKKPLPADASPDEIKTWRAENGIPEEPSGYTIELGNGRVVGEADKPLVESFTKTVHGKHWTPDRVNEALNWYYDQQERLAEQQQGRDAQYRKDSEDALRQEFGTDYRRNVRIANEFFDGLGELGKRLLGGRTADGRLIAADPDLIRWAVQKQLEQNPLATVMPGGGQGGVQAMETEIATLKGLMADPGSKYWKGPEATKLQTRYRELLEAKLKIGKAA
jgi:hypothetical protein